MEEWMEKGVCRGSWNENGRKELEDKGTEMEGTLMNREGSVTSLGSLDNPV